MAQQPLVGKRILIIEASRSHSDTTHSVEPRTGDQHDAQISTWQHTKLTRDRHPYILGNANPRSQQACGCRPTPEIALSLGSAPQIRILWFYCGISLRYPWVYQSVKISFFLYYQTQEYILLKRSILSEIYNKTFPKTNPKTFHRLWHSVKTLEIQWSFFDSTSFALL